MKILKYFITHHRVANIIILLFFICGFFSMVNTRREKYPPVAFDQLSVTTYYPGASPEVVENNVTCNIEKELKQVSNIKKMTSVSAENVSMVLLELEGEKESVAEAKLSIREAVERVQDLPEEVTGRPVVDELKASSQPILQFSLNGDMSELELRKHARNLESKILEIKGVAKVSKIGYRAREVHVKADSEELQNNFVSLFNIIDAIKSRNVRQSGGSIHSYISEKKVVTLSEYNDPAELDNVIIQSNSEGYLLHLSEVSDIENTFEDAQTLYRANGKTAIGLIVVAQNKTDTINLRKKVLKAVDEYKENGPEKLTVALTGDEVIVPQTMISMMVVNGIMGFVLVVVVLFLFLDFQSGFWSAFGIPFSIISSFMLFRLFDMSINMMTLLTMILLLGIIVDDAIVISEKIYSNRQKGMNHYDACIDGVKSMIKPVSASILTTVLGFFPLLFISGPYGRLMRPVPLVAIFLLGISLIDAAFFVPVHIQGVKRRKKRRPSKKDKILKKVLGRYEKVLTFCFRHKIKVFTSFCASLILLFVIVGPHVTFMLEQQIDSGYFRVTVEAPNGTPLDKTNSFIPEIEDAIITSVPEGELQSVVTEVGHHNSIGFFGNASGKRSNWAIVTVELIPAAKRTVTTEKVVEALSPKLEAIKKKYSLDRLDTNEPDSMAGKPVEVTVVSDNDKLRDSYENKIRRFLDNQDGVKNIQSSNIPGKEELRLVLDYEKLSMYGLSSSAVASTVRTAFEGYIATTIDFEGESVDVRVKLNDPEQYREENILDIPVANNNGMLIKLKHFAHLEDDRGEAAIHHRGGKRTVTINADIDTDIITSQEVNSRLKKELESILPYNPDVEVIYGGEQEETESSTTGVLFAAIFVILSIYFLLVVVFDSYMQPLFVMAIIPFAVAGALTTLCIHRHPLVLISLLGMLGLVGVVVNDTIVMISNLNDHCILNGFSVETAIKAASERFRPVILTTLTTFAGLIPTAYGIGGDIPTISPMVLVMAWGLLFCTVVTLVFIPVLFSLFKIKKESGTTSRKGVV